MPTFVTTLTEVITEVTRSELAVAAVGDQTHTAGHRITEYTPMWRA